MRDKEINPTSLKLRGVKKIISKLPEAPGVYKFMKGGRVLYVGKATSLRDRVKSYFNKNIESTRGPLISKMLSEFDDIKFIKTDSVLEALILEANLIKKYQPEANTKEKDNKSFNYVVITKEDFPRVLVMRERELSKSLFTTPLEKHGNFLLKISSVRRRRSSRGFSQGDGSTDLLNSDIAYSFGPFPNGSQLKEAMKIIRKMFPFRDKCTPFLLPSLSQGEGQGVRSKPCFNRQIGLCPGVCTGEITKREYSKTIKNITLFFESNKDKLIKNLEKQMKGFAKSREFEKAQKIKKTIFTLNHIQDVSLLKDDVSRLNLDTKFRIESYDIAHLSGTNVVGVMTVIEDGEVKKSDYRKFKIKENPGINDTEALLEVLSRRLNHNEWARPNLIVVDGGKAQKNIMEKVLKENKINIPVVSVVKDEKHKPIKILGIEKLQDLKIEKLDLSRGALVKWENQILLANAEAHRFAIGFHKKLRGKIV
ncbi:MAG: UvrABC system protein C [Parcubacteria group bacterium GW2011_GWB1_35_5]|nr:MAG: UvrABC system protein C [Parcubacteria group bacterium GW2011_GWB1_35_5]